MGYQRSITRHHRTLFFWEVDVAVYKVSNMDKEAKKHVPKKCRRDIWRKHGLIETSLVILYSAEGITSNDVKDRGTYLKIKL